MSTITIAPVKFRTTCSWCILFRPGRAPNYIYVQTLKSAGICPECSEAMATRNQKAAR